MAESPTVRSRARLRRAADRLFTGTTGLFALLLIVVLLALFYLLGRQAKPALDAFGFPFLWSQAWNPTEQRFGALPYIYGTLASSLLALALAIPVSVGTAIALTELLPGWLSRPLGFFVELLAAVPSIIYGIWGVAVVVPFVQALGGPDTFGYSLLSAAIVLAIMVLPIIASVSRDMLRAVPGHQREAALAMGATRWEVTWRIVLPGARPGIAAAAILGLGRAIGETMAVILVIGNQPILSWGLFDPAATMASLIANEFGDPSGPLHRASLVEMGLILLAISLLLNLAARYIVHRFGRRVRA